MLQWSKFLFHFYHRSNASIHQEAREIEPMKVYLNISLTSSRLSLLRNIFISSDRRRASIDTCASRLRAGLKSNHSFPSMRNFSAYSGISASSLIVR